MKKKTILLSVLILLVGVSAYPWPWGGGGGGGGAGDNITITNSPTTTLPWDNITSRPTINSVTVTGAVLDNVSNYPASLVRGPASATDSYFAYFDGTSGKLLKDGQSSVNPAFSTINVYGANALNLGTAGTYAGQIRFKSAGSATNYFPIIAPATFTDNVGWTLPTTGASGGSGYLLTVGNTGVMGYTAPPGTLAALAAGTMTDTKYCIYTASGNQVVCNTTPAGSGDVSGGSTSVDGELAAYNSTGGKTIKQSFFKPSGPASSVKTYTFPNASATVLTDNVAVTVAQGGTNASTAADARTNLGLGTISTLTAGTMTDTKACIYTASGTQIVCNTTIAGGGDFSGPASSTDNAIVIFNGTGGKTGKNSLVTIDNNGKVTAPGGYDTGPGTDGQTRITLGNNTSISPTAATDEIYFEGNVLKVNENGTERTVAKTDGNVATATALAANGSNCTATQAAIGVDASGAAEGCWTPENTSNKSDNTSLGSSATLYPTQNAVKSYVDTVASGKAATNQTMNIGTTAVAINRASAALVLTGITSIDGSAASATTATTASNVAVGSDANGDILVRGASAYGRLAAVAAGQPLLSGGTSTAPAYAGYTFSATAGQTYTFPATSKTLMATDGNTSGTAANVSGTPALPNGTTATRQAADDATDKLATDNWVITQAYAKLASPTFSGTPSLPTGTTAVLQSANDNSTKIATTSYVDQRYEYDRVNIDQPALTDNVIIAGPLDRAWTIDNVVVVIQDNTGKLSTASTDNVTFNVQYNSDSSFGSATSVFSSNQTATGAAVFSAALNNTAPLTGYYIRVVFATVNMTNKKFYIRIKYHRT